MTDLRRDLAEQMCAGLGGWLQLQAAQGLEELSGEDSARALLAPLVAVRGNFVPQTSQLPLNWGDTKKRVDLVLRAEQDREGLVRCH